MVRGLETLDLNFNNPTVSETRQHQRMAEEIELIQAYAPEIEIRSRRAKIENPEKYDMLLRAARKAGIRVEEIGADTGKKRYHIIHILEYTRLDAKDGEKVTTMSAKPSRIGEVYRDYIKTAKAIQIS